MTTDSVSFELSEDLLTRAQYQVAEDPDQPGLYQWTRQEFGRTVGGAEISMDTPEEAWAEVREIVEDVLLNEADITAEEWNAMPAELRQQIIDAHFGDRGMG